MFLKIVSCTVTLELDLNQYPNLKEAKVQKRKLTLEIFDIRKSAILC